MKYEYDKELFDFDQIRMIKYVIEKGIDERAFKLMTQINKKGEPALNFEQMREINEGTKELTFEEIQTYAKFNSDLEPIFSANQMRAIRAAYDIKLPPIAIDIITKTINDAPIFTDIQIYSLTECFIWYSEKEMQQIEECINDGLLFEQIKPFINCADANKIRILKTFYSFGCDKDDIENIIAHRIDYDNIKNIKYLLQCAKHLNISSDDILYFDNYSFSVEKMHYNLLFRLSTKRLITDFETQKMINKCLQYKLPPEQIDYITDAKNMFNSDGVKSVAIALLNGLTIKEIDNISKNAIKKHLSLIHALDEAVRIKCNDISNLDGDVSCKTDWFDEIEK